MRVLGFCVVLLVGCAMHAAASYAADTKNSNAEMFAKHSAFTSVSISPGGDYLAVGILRDGKRAAAVLDLDTKAVKSLITFKDPLEVASIRWLNEERLLVTMARKIGSLEMPGSAGELYAVNADGSKGKNIFGFMGVEPIAASGRYIGKLDDEHILVEVHPWSGVAGKDLQPSVMRVNINNGRTRELTRTNIRGANFLVDDDKEARFAMGLDDDFNFVFSYRAKGELDWQLVDSPFTLDVTPLGFESGKERILMLAPDPETSVIGVFSYDPTSGKAEQVYVHPVADVSNLYTDKEDQVYGVRIDQYYPEFIALTPEHELAQIQKMLLASFSQGYVYVTSATENRDKIVFALSAPNLPARYYLFEPEKKKATFLLDAYPNIDPKVLANQDAIEISARDGTTLRGYLTLPPGSTGKGLPMVVMPHGGPHARDMWGYDPSVQMLALEGYAVLQINFRGSTGYGTDFRDAGYGEWGRKTQEDIIDATYWAVKEGIADKERLAIFGASFGGYSALQAPIIDPDLYKAAIGYVGVYDLDMLYTTGDIKTTRWGDAYLDTTLPDNEADRIAQSPARNVDKLKAALFIVHGVDDPRAAFEHAEVLRDALDEIDYPYEWLAKDGEGHGFYDVDNRTELNNKVLAFLEKHLN